MDARRISRCIAGAAMIATALTACTSGGEGMSASEAAGLPDDATVTYAFHDSSVPPQYHRSFTLTVTREESRIVVDSYTDVLADESAPTPAEVWATLGATLPQVSALDQDDPQEGCTGGTGADLIVESAEGRVVDLSPQFCGGANDALEAPMAAWIAPARGIFPPIDVLAPEGE